MWRARHIRFLALLFIHIVNGSLTMSSGGGDLPARAVLLFMLGSSSLSSSDASCHSGLRFGGLDENGRPRSPSNVDRVCITEAPLR